MMISETVLLLVEDEILIQELVDDGLTEAGFKVVSARSGTEAIKQLGDDASRFRAVITDIRIGKGPNGWDVAKRARELVHNMPIVYMSGSEEKSGHQRVFPTA